MKIVTFKWKAKNKYRSEFDAKAVNVLADMVRRNVDAGFDYEFICITDDPTGLSRHVNTLSLWPNPVPDFGGVNKPNCFYRLRAFAEDMKDLIGPRFCWLDLDCVITGDITPILRREGDFIINRSSNIRQPYNGSLVLMDAGARKQVWDDFDPVRSPLLGRQKGYVGSDQAWIGYTLGNDEERFTNLDGVYAYQTDIVAEHDGQLPINASIVFFHGKHNPWDLRLQTLYPWIKDNYYEGD